MRGENSPDYDRVNIDITETEGAEEERERLRSYNGDCAY